MLKNEIVQLKSYNEETGKEIGNVLPITNSEAVKVENDKNLKQTLVDMNDKIEQTNESLDNITQQATIFQISKKAWKDGDKKGRYEAWCSGTTFYDEELDKICLVYNAKSSHTSKDGDVYLRTKSDYGEFSEPLVVAKHDTNYGKRCHGAGITKEGYYVALVLHYADTTGNGKLYRYLSTDKGQSWIIREVLLNGENKLSGESCSVFKTKTGRLLSFNRLAPSPSSGICIIRSDNNGYDWQYTMLNKGTAPNPLEGNFIQLSNGDIYCVVRGNLYTGDFTRLQNTYITKSTDNGATWTTLEVMNDIDASFNPVALLYNEDNKTIEMLYGSRLMSSDGYGSLYQRICKEEDFIKGIYGKEIKIMQGGNGADFGYVGIAKSKNNVVNAFYYNGEKGSTSIYNMVGTRGSSIVAPDINSNQAAINLPTNTINGNTLPSELDKYLNTDNGIIICRQFDTQPGLPINKKGFLKIYRIGGGIKGYSRMYFYPSCSSDVYTRFDRLTLDEWSEWELMNNNIEFDETISNTPFTSYSYLKKPVELFHSSTDTITSQVVLDCKTKFNNEWFNNNCDGVKLEVVLQNVTGNTEKININFDTHTFGSVPQRRIVCSHDYEINSYIDTFVKPNVKTINVYINKPEKIQTLIIKAVGLLYKQSN